jgi:hypothetical protein
MEKVYIASPSPRYDNNVLIIQRQLNSIKSGLLHNLPIVKEDGLYGEETARAVKAFQQACNISADGRFGSQTSFCMMQKLREMPSIGAAPSKYYISTAPPKYYISAAPANSKRKPYGVFSLYDVVDQFIGAVIDFNVTLKTVASDVASLRNPSADMVFRCFRGSIETIDPTLKRMQETLSKYHLHNESSFVSADTLNVAKGNSIHPSLQGRAAAQTVSMAKTNERMAKYFMKEATSAKDAILNNLKRYDFVSKITSKLKSMGLSGKVDLSKVNIKSTGLGVGFIYSLKDIIWDIFHIADLFDETKKEAWLNDLQKDCYDFLDALIIGCVSCFIAQLVVVGGAALAGLTISSGAIVVAIVIVSLIIGLVFSYVLSSKDISFSRFIFEDCAEFIIGKIYGVSM